MTLATIQLKKRQAIMCLQSNRLREACDILVEICRTDSTDLESWYFLGITYGQLGQLDEALKCCQRAISLGPAFAPAYIALGNVLQLQGEFNEAAKNYQQALRLQPDSAETYNNLGNTLMKLGDLAAALANYRKALNIKPGFVEAINNLASCLQKHGEFDQAITYYRQAVKLRPDFVQAHNNLGCVLRSCGELEQAIVHFREALRQRPDYHTAHSNLLLVMHYLPPLSPESLSEEHRRWGATHGGVTMPGPAMRELKTDKRLRIGFVSPDFRTHSVSYFIEPVLANYDHVGFEFFCYADVARPDATTERLKNMTDHWRNIYGLHDEQVIRLILQDEIDILVDLAGHTAENRLRVFAHKPAPIQITYLGYPDTTGLTTMDYRLTDAWADPPGSTEHYHTETLIRLTGGFLCYRAPSATPPVGMSPCHATGRITFGCFNDLAKINTDVVRTWSKILNSVTGSRLILKNNSFADPAVARRYLAKFSAHGVEPERLEMLPPTKSHHEHMGLYGRVDIALDTFPYNGTTTTCEALWMGTPVITLVGPVHVSRVGLSLLSQIGLPELAAHTQEQYIDLTHALAGDIGRLSRLRAELRPRLENSPLRNEITFMRELENIYRTMWHRYCETRADA